MSIGFVSSAEEVEQRLEDVPDHRGQSRPQTMEMFAAPPAGMGEILSAESTLRRGCRPWSLWNRIMFTAIVGALVWGALAWVQDWNSGRSNEPHVVAWVGVIVFGPLAWYFTRFSKRCTYVGRDGIATLSAGGSRQQARVLVFSQAAELQAHIVRQYLNGAYVATKYHYTWRDAAGKKLFNVSCAHNCGKQAPRRLHAVHFALAAERAWSEHFLRRAQAQLQSEGSIAFRVAGGRSVRVGPGFIEFQFGDQPERVTRDEIASVSLGNGVFSIKHKDARWYSRAGKYRFHYPAMGNAQVFILALERLMGYSCNVPPAKAA